MSICSCGSFSCCDCNPVAASINAIENGPVHDVKKGVSVRVSDRNGNPKDLEVLEDSILHSDGTSVEMRDGSVDKPISLNPEVVPYGDSILILRDGKILGQLKPDVTKKLFLVSDGGIVKLDEAIFRDNIFTNVTAASQGKLVIMLCSDSNSQELGTLQGLVGLLKVNVDGTLTITEQVELEELCDLAEPANVNDYTHTIACGNAGLVKIPKPPILTGGTGCKSYDAAGSGLAWPTFAFTLPPKYANYIVRIDVFVEGVVSGGGGHFLAGMVINGTLIRNSTPGSLIIAGWAGSGLVQIATTDSWGGGYAQGELEDGDHVLTFTNLFGGFNMQWLNILVTWWPKEG